MYIVDKNKHWANCWHSTWHIVYLERNLLMLNLAWVNPRSNLFIHTCPLQMFRLHLMPMNKVYTVSSMILSFKRR